MLGGLFGGGKPKLSPFEQQMQNNQLNLSNLGMNAMQGAGDYWSKILKGGPDATLALSPEIRNIHGMFGNLLKQAGQFGPMGGGRANLMAQAPYQEAGKLSDLFATARPAAASGLAGLGGSALSGAGGLQGILNGQLARTQAGAQNGGMLGSGIFNILKGLPLQKWLGGGGGGGGGDLPFGSSGWDPNAQE
jgi:hypothetical protein